MPSSSRPPPPPPVLQRFDLHAKVLPRRLRGLDPTLTSVDVLGDLEATRAVAIVGSRLPTDESAAYARRLASELARRDVVVVSGGATGIDQAAHEGALDAKGRTWCVLASTWPQITPASNADLFARIEGNGGTLFWTGAGRDLLPAHFLQRNKLLVGLSDAVVVVQAGEKSGSRNAAKCARAAGRALWVVPPSPWLDRLSYRGNVLELKNGARPLLDEEELFLTLHVPAEAAAPVAQAQPLMEMPERHDAVELAILRALGDAAPAVLHVDEIVSKSSIPYPAAASALLTLCLEAVVVEGPGGFYRRRLATTAARNGRHRDGRDRPRSNSSR